MIPVLNAPTNPIGLPTANTSSPTRALLESASVAAGKTEPEASKEAKSRARSRDVTTASKVRPSHSFTCACEDLTTCALVTINPSALRITPDPNPRPLLPTCTVVRRSASATSPNPACAMALAPARPFCDLDGQLDQFAAANGLNFPGFSYRVRIQERLQIVGLLQCMAFQSYQNVADHQASAFRGTTRLHAEHNNSIRVGQREFGL